MKEFEGKTAIVTGAASGIGVGLAEKFAKERMQVVMADVEEEALNKAVEKLKPISSLIWTCPTPSNSYSTGSSAVKILRWGLETSFRIL